MLILTIFASWAALTVWFTDFAAFCGVLAGSVVALGGVFAAIKKIGLHKPFIWLWNHLFGAAINDYYTKLLDEKLEPIKKELRENGGGSIKDAVKMNGELIIKLNDENNAMHAQLQQQIDKLKLEGHK